ncbi:MAG: hypothetical protein IJY57_04560, partial [Clostridia bacterium]|nr:hypothetical protein [Clostridia bacterium]
MKKTKSLSVLILSILLVFALFLGVHFIKPENRVKAIAGSQYFSYVESDNDGGDITLENDKVVIPMQNGDESKLTSKVVIDNFEIKFNMPENATKLTFTVKADSLIATGNPLVVDGETTYETKIENKVVFEVEGTTLKASFNDGTVVNLPYTANMDLTVAMVLNGNTLTASANGNALNYTATDYHKLATVSGVVKADITFAVETLDTFTENALFAVEYIDQNTAVSNEYKQAFKLNAEETAFETIAKSRILFAESFFVGNLPVGYDNVVLDGKNYTVAIENYSVINDNTLNNVKLIASESFAYVGDVSNTSKLLNFNIDGASSDVTLSFVDKEDATKVYDEYTIKVVDKDETAPTYVDASLPENQVAIASFENALEKATKAEYDVDGQKKEYSIRLGEGQNLELPSLKSLVSDNLTSYKNLKYTVSYSNITENSTNSVLKIPVKVAGDYFFYVVFTDEEGNAMKNDDFYKVEDDAIVPGMYNDFVFGFNLNDDAPMLITAASQGAGYKGVVYTASAFTITASGYTSEYSLYYSESEIEEGDSGWKEIYALTDVSNGLESEHFTTEQLEKFAYDGNLTFTPTEKGYYKLVCKVNSSNSERSVSKSAIIEVMDEPAYVKPDSKWLQNNLASVIFLSVGTLCLIGIIVLLCIKPKTNETNEDVK